MPLFSPIFCNMRLDFMRTHYKKRVIVCTYHEKHAKQLQKKC